MPQNKSITFSENDIYDDSLIEVVGGKASLVFGTGAPIPNSTFWATYTDSVNGNFGLGDTTGNPVGNAVISNERLDLASNDLSYVSYDGVGNASYVQTGAIKFKYTPNYTSSPSSTVTIFLSEEIGSVNNLITIEHFPTDTIRINLRDSTGLSVGGYIAVYIANLGQTYEFELNFDSNTGEVQLFIDGVSTGNFGIPAIRSNTTNQILIGTDQAKTVVSNFFIEDLIIYDTVQHTANYTPGYILPVYTTSNPTIIPQASYNFKDFLEYVEDSTKPEGTEIKYVLQDGVTLKYWDGNNIVISDGTYAQSNTATEIQNAKTLIQFIDPVKLIVFLNSDGAATPIL